MKKTPLDIRRLEISKEYRNSEIKINKYESKIN